MATLVRNKGEIIMWETLRKEEVLKSLETDRKYGITEEEANRRRQNMERTNYKTSPKRVC